MNTVLRLAVVGHTNTGKTSLLRTLLRDPGFGEVADAPSTTKHVEAASLTLTDGDRLEFYDTPGLESASYLLDFLEHLVLTQGRADGPSQIQRFLATPAARHDYEQEAKVLRQMLQSDAALYVVDAREPALAKYRDELQILNLCGKPVLPVLNFVNDPAHQATTWRRTLAALGLHIVVEFDTVAPALDGETELYERLAVSMHEHGELLRRLNADLQTQRRLRHASALNLIADTLLDVAACRRHTPREAVEKAGRELQDEVRAQEQKTVLALLQLFGFDPHTVSTSTLPPGSPRLDHDLFHPEALKDLGMQVGLGVASGAAAGAAVDLFTAGLSLGAGTVVGAAVGGLWQTGETLGRRVLSRIRGWEDLSVGDTILAALTLRLLGLTEALEQRGHAAQDTLQLELHPTIKHLQRGRLPQALQEARAKPAWSRLNREFENDKRRQRACDTLAATLGTWVHSGTTSRDADDSLPPSEG